MIKRNHIRHFLAIVETGSFTRAADRVRVAQPTLSASIAELERLTGTRLFLRDRRQLRLTEAGNQFANFARVIEQNFRAAEASFNDLTASSTPLRLGFIPSIATNMMAHIMCSLGPDCPLVLVEGSDADLRRKLGHGHLDVVLTLMRVEDIDRPSLIMIEEGYRLMVATDHEFANATMLTAHDVASQTMIARRSCEILGETSRWFTQRGVRPPFFLKSQNDDLCMQMVASGMGVTTAPQSLVRTGINAIALAEYDFQRTIGLLAGRDRPDLVDERHPLAVACLSCAAL